MKRLEYLINKFYILVEKLGKQNVILVMFLGIVLLITGLYSTFSLYTTSEGLQIIDGLPTYKFILDSEMGENTFIIPANSDKNIDIVIKNEEEIDLKYGIYYTSNNDLTYVTIGSVKAGDANGVGVIEPKSTYKVTVRAKNDSSSDVTINFGLSYGNPAGGQLKGPTGARWVNAYFLNSVPVGSYVKYEGKGGTVGETAVACKKGGSSSNSDVGEETEAPNSCLGQNAREDLEAQGSETYGVCGEDYANFLTTGWRVAYIDEDGKAVIVSSGSPECKKLDESIDKSIEITNTMALKYCNKDLVDGDCSCIDIDGDGLCDSASSDAWAINDTDFYYMTKAINGGYGKRLTEFSSGLGDVGGTTLGNTLYCLGQSVVECGVENDLISNGGVYWFASKLSSATDAAVLWNPSFLAVFTFGINAVNDMAAYGLRPVISLSSSVVVTGGTGTMDDPYIIKNGNDEMADTTIGANAPNLDDGLIPVYFDTNTNKWKKADSNNPGKTWYDYEARQWANAVLVTDNSRKTYLNAAPGSIVLESDIIGFYVWIPRYKYRVWNINRQAGVESTYLYPAYTNGIEIMWEDGKKSTGNVSCTYDSVTNGADKVLNDKCTYMKQTEILTTSVNSDYTEAWYTHPAFRIKGKEVEGFWIGKFETTGSITSPTVLPDAVSIGNQTVAVMYNTSKLFQNYGLSKKIEAHMLTNLEWAAVAYLSHSKYGLCDGTKCRDVYINNSSSYYTGRSAGGIANTTDITFATVYPANSTAATMYIAQGYYNYKGYFIDYSGNVTTTRNLAKVASTNGNITGVYDMVGGKYEYVMGNVSKSAVADFAPASSGFTTLSGVPYDSYAYGNVYNTQIAYNRSMLGDGLAEIVNTVSSATGGWKSPESTTGAQVYMAQASDSRYWFYRGGYAQDANAGLFYAYGMTGGANAAYGFRSSIS